MDQAQEDNDPIWDKFVDVVHDIGGLSDKSLVTRDATLKSLDLDSLTIVESNMEFEKVFEIDITNEDEELMSDMTTLGQYFDFIKSKVAEA